jgi:hypothetical protein
MKGALGDQIVSPAERFMQSHGRRPQVAAVGQRARLDWEGTSVLMSTSHVRSCRGEPETRRRGRQVW